MFLVAGADTFSGCLVSSHCVDIGIYNCKILEGMLKEHMEMVMMHYVLCHSDYSSLTPYLSFDIRVTL